MTDNPILTTLRGECDGCDGWGLVSEVGGDLLCGGCEAERRVVPDNPIPTRATAEDELDGLRRKLADVETGPGVDDERYFRTHHNLPDCPDDGCRYCTGEVSSMAVDARREAAAVELHKLFGEWPSQQWNEVPESQRDVWRSRAALVLSVADEAQQ